MCASRLWPGSTTSRSGEEFDEHDRPDAKYIVLLDDAFPVATCRLYEISGEALSSVMLGRVVVLPEYRKKGIGKMAVTEAENWAREMGVSKIGSREPGCGRRLL